MSVEKPSKNCFMIFLCSKQGNFLDSGLKIRCLVEYGEARRLLPLLPAPSGWSRPIPEPPDQDVSSALGGAAAQVPSGADSPASALCHHEYTIHIAQQLESVYY